MCYILLECIVYYGITARHRLELFILRYNTILDMSSRVTIVATNQRIYYIVIVDVRIV